MPLRHLFAAPDATHGHTLCGLDVRPPSPLLTRPQRWRECFECQHKRRALDRNVTTGSQRKHHTDRIAED